SYPPVDRNQGYTPVCLRLQEEYLLLTTLATVQSYLSCSFNGLRPFRAKYAPPISPSKGVPLPSFIPHIACLPITLHAARERFADEVLHPIGYVSTDEPRICVSKPVIDCRIVL